MARYAGQLQAPAEGSDQGRGFFALRQKHTFKAVLAHFKAFLCTEVTLIRIINNLKKFENNPRKSKKISKI